MEKKEKNTVKKEFVVQALIDKIEKENQDIEIKTRIVKGYDSPKRIAKQDSDQKGFTPDVLSSTPEKTDLYEVELTQDYKLEKWKLFSLYSNKLKGTFNIVTPQNNLTAIRNKLKENNIKAKIIYFA